MSDRKSFKQIIDSVKNIPTNNNRSIEYRGRSYFITRMDTNLYCVVRRNDLKVVCSNLVNVTLFLSGHGVW